MYSKKYPANNRVTPSKAKTVHKYSRTLILLSQPSTKLITPLEKSELFTVSTKVRFTGIARITKIFTITIIPRITTIARIVRIITIAIESLESPHSLE